MNNHNSSQGDEQISPRDYVFLFSSRHEAIDNFPLAWVEKGVNCDVSLKGKQEGIVITG